MSSVTRVRFSTARTTAVGLLTAVLGGVGTPPHLAPATSQPRDLQAPPTLAVADIVGDYRLTHLAWNASAPEAPLPAWTWPGRFLVLEGSLVLRADGRYITTARSRETMFGDTVYRAGVDSGSWLLKPGNTIQFLTGRHFPEDQARVSRGVVVVYGGGIGSGGTMFRYQRP
jgi:hypothetical protein